MRRRVPEVRVVMGGVSLATLRATVTTPVVLSVGLAGGLDDGLEPGTVVVPERIAGGGGDEVATDPSWTAALAAASRRLGLPTAGGALVTTAEVVTGRARGEWAARGFIAADMESAAIAGLAPAIAAVRVILDTPSREISPLWQQPLRAAIRPGLWRQGAWLARRAPRLALRAADVLAECLRGQALQGDVDAQI